MIGDGSCNSVGEISVFLMKAQERDHGTQEILDVLGLGLHTSASIGFLAFGETLGSSLDFEFSTDAFNGCCWCPNSFREYLPTFLLGHNPMISCCLDTAGQRSVPRRKQNPAFWCAMAKLTPSTAPRTVFGVGPGENIRESIISSPP